MYKRIIYCIAKLCFIGLCIFPVNASSQEIDSIPIRLGSEIQKPIYTEAMKKRNSFYNWAWGKHYKDLYYQPITTKTVSLNSLFGGLSVRKQLPKLHALVLDNNKRFYILKPLGGSSSFLESKFFQSVYKREDFKDTYLNDFITEAYTVVHPYMFVTAESLARSAGLCYTDPHVYYVSEGNQADTIADGSLVKNKLVSISLLPKIEEDVINDIPLLLEKLHGDELTTVDQQMYIRTRLFDMLIGDWNKTPENWYWLPSQRGDSTVYMPQVFDRSHAFSKVDGVFFKELLNMLGVGFIANYEGHLKNVKKFNSLSYALDIAITQQQTASAWSEQAKILKQLLTDDVIDNAFLKLPSEMQNDEAREIKNKLKQRRNELEETAIKYYVYTQKTPVITGTDKSNRFVVEQDHNKNLRIRIYDQETNRLIVDKKYTRKHTKEIWVYGLKGDDTFEVDKEKGNISVLLIGGEGNNIYNITRGKNVFVYEAKSEKERLKSLTEGKVIIPNDEGALEYNYEQLKHSTLSFTPIGIYDSDLGLNLGTSVAYTIYGFRRAPYTRRHQISYDYTNGFTYQGIFPSYDEKKSLHVAAYLGSPAYFSNFFGFGNDTHGHKGEKNNYNRVNIRKYMLAPALYYNLTKEQTINVTSSFEMYKVKNPKDRDRYINQVYEDGSPIFSNNYYLNLSGTYELDKKMKGFVSSVKVVASTGWNVSLRHPDKNYAYVNGSIGVNLKITDRITFATLVKGKSLFSDKYEFFQAATTELRGFRNNRFIGKQSLYQYSDIRLDMGKLQNPLTPLNYGVFVGVDHGRVWYPDETSNKWHSSYGGGFWLTLLRKFTGKFSYFGSTDGSRFMFQLGMGF